MSYERAVILVWMLSIVQVYAVVKEKRSSRLSDTICASRQHRESLVYSSLSNRIEVRIVTNSPSRRRHRSDYFAIRYERSLVLIIWRLYILCYINARIIIIIGAARIVCGAWSMKRYGVRPSVCLSHSPAAAACGGFTAVILGPDLQNILRFIVRSTYDIDLKSAKISFRSIVS